MDRQPKLSHAAATLLALFFTGHVAAQPAPAGAPPPPPVVSPEIAANGDVTLRLRAPQAGKVEVVGLARDGNWALELCSGQVPDAAFIDVRMPPGWDGIETTW